MPDINDKSLKVIEITEEIRALLSNLGEGEICAVMINLASWFAVMPVEISDTNGAEPGDNKFAALAATRLATVLDQMANIGVNCIVDVLRQGRAAHENTLERHRAPLYRATRT